MTRGERRALFRSIVRWACEAPGEMPADARKTAAEGGTFPGAMGALVARIREAAHLVGDADVQAAQREGHSEGALYELTVTTALGESGRRLEAVLSLLGRGG